MTGFPWNFSAARFETRPRIAVALVGLFVWGGLAFPALGQAPHVSASTETGGLEQQARQEFERGVMLGRRERFREAADAFNSAWSLAKRPNIAFNLAVVRYRIGSYVAARQALLAYDELAQQGDPHEAEAKHLHDLLDRLLVRVALRVAPGEAAVYLDGELQPGTGPLRSFFVDPGRRKVTISHAGYRSTTQAFTAAAGQRASFEIALDRAATPKDLAATPAQTGIGSWGTQRWVGVGVGAAGIAGVVAGSVFGSLALIRKNQSADDCVGNSCGPDGSRYRSAAVRWGNRATVAWVAGGALLGAAAAIFFTAPGEEREQAALQLEAGFDLHGGRLGVLGAF